MKIELTEASFSYNENQAIFKDVSLSLDKGEILSILGPNGSGKTTLLKALVGIVDLNEGKILVDNKNMTHRNDRSMLFGYVPQTKGMSWSYSVWQMVLMGRARYIGPFSRPSEKDLEIANKSLEKIGILNLKNRRFSELSGGECQLVLIARALASESNILVFDEPTSALDIKNQYSTLKLLYGLAHGQGFSIIFSTHNPTHALYISDKALLLKKENESKYGTTQSVLNEKNIHYAYGIDVRIISCPHNGNCLKGIFPLVDLNSAKEACYKS